ncbi:MAG: 30S ribosomal protein S20 [SAR116 cluster bacterium]|nr:30S ribosomal protein S20 [SAR116 cluster bacterium]RPH11472.1 MAG: 30S ribosomal protein S20 [Alphaproteobacteria bacterium TMED54]
MANHKSAKKRIRRNDKFQLINKVRKTRVRTFIKKVENYILDNDKKNAEIAFKLAQPEMHRSVGKGVFKKNTISRKLSRLSSKIKLIK